MIIILFTSNFPIFLFDYNDSSTIISEDDFEKDSMKHLVKQESKVDNDVNFKNQSQVARWDDIFTKNYYFGDALIKIRGDDKIEFILKKKNTQYSSELRRVLSNYDIEIAEEYYSSRIGLVYIPLKTIKFSFEDLMEQLKGLAELEFIEPNYFLETDVEINDNYYSKQWDLDIIHMETAWEKELGSRDIKVAVIDTGLDYNHPDLSANYVPLGYDWVNDDNDPMDDNNHGTHCAGTVAAAINNSIGIAGMANISIFAEKCLDEDGGGYTSDIADGIIDATDQGAYILSCSFGGSTYSQNLKSAIDYAISKGVMVIASAGNSASEDLHYPACYPGVIAVSATDKTDGLATFSNYGDWIDIAAPGVDIYSTITNNHYDSHDGTSMACPHVAGLAALLMSKYPTYTSEQIEILLYNSAADLGDPGYDAKFGHGRINTSNVFTETPHDLAVTLEIPSTPEIGNTYVINATVKNNFEHIESNVDFFLYLNGSLVNSTTISTLGAEESKLLNYTWVPKNSGRNNFTAYAPSVIQESFTSNNKITQFALITSNYSIVVNSTYNWIDASKGTELFLDDDGYSSQSLSFNFLFYNTWFSSVYIGANGYLSFTDPTPDDYSNDPIPSEEVDNTYLIAPFWTDIITKYGGGGGKIYVQSFNEYWVVEWENVEHINGYKIGSFEIVLHKNGNIIFNYDYLNYIDSSDGYTCGLNLGIDARYYNIYQKLNETIDDFSLCFSNRSNSFKPNLTDGSYSIAEGFLGPINQTTRLNFSINYKDGDNDSPLFINVLINGTIHPMEKKVPTDENYINGCNYQYLTYLQLGKYNYSFKCGDYKFSNYTSVKTDLTVEEKSNDNTPNLNNGHVNPILGYVNLTLFAFKINYSDLDNNMPQNISISINSTLYYMTKQDPEDSNYMDGCWYVYITVLPTIGNYTFHFNCSDGENRANSDSIEGPNVIYSSLWDGLVLNYIYTMGSSSNSVSYGSKIRYVYVIDVIFRVFWYLKTPYDEDLIISMFIGKWDVNLDTRIMSSSSGDINFGSGTHSPFWIFRNSTINDHVWIAVDEEGDHEFEISGEKKFYQYGYEIFDVWVLEDLDIQGGVAYYDKNTGQLIQGTFYYGGGYSYYSFSLPVIEESGKKTVWFDLFKNVDIFRKVNDTNPPIPEEIFQIGIDMSIFVCISSFIAIALIITRLVFKKKILNKIS